MIEQLKNLVRTTASSLDKAIEIFAKYRLPKLKVVIELD